MVITVCVDCGHIDVSPNEEFAMPKRLSMSYQEMRDGLANIMVDGEIHTFVWIDDNGITYWQDQSSGKTFDTCEFDLF